MRLRLIATAAILAFAPVAAEASDICQALQRRLATLPQIIGSTADVRRHADTLRQYNDEIRFLRTEMRRARCGGRSIVTFGKDDVCGEIASELRDMEMQRDGILAQRSAARQIIRPSGERNAIMAALDANACNTGEATTPLPVAIDPETAPDADTEKKPFSSITTVPSKSETAPPALLQSEAPPAQPERPYDPSRNVRSVGPTFLPDDSSIDLSNPAADGAQPRQ